MKAYVIASHSTGRTDFQFLWHDVAFLRRLQYAYKHCGNCQVSEKPSEYGSLVQMFLSPIIMSYSTLRSTSGFGFKSVSCSKVQCEVIFQEHDDLLYIGFCDKGEVSAFEMRKALSILHKLTGFFYGLCQNDLRPLNSNERERVWNKLSETLNSYMKLYDDDKGFLVDCSDSMHVNSDVYSHCSSIMEHSIKVLAEMLSSPKKMAGFLFVGTKMLASENSLMRAFDIQTSDLLLILALINSKHVDKGPDVPIFDGSSAADAFDLSWPDDNSSTGEDHDSNSSSAGLDVGISDPTEQASGSPVARDNFSSSKLNVKTPGHSIRSRSWEARSSMQRTSSLSAKTILRANSSPGCSSEARSRRLPRAKIPTASNGSHKIAKWPRRPDLSTSEEATDNIAEVVGRDLSDNSDIQTCLVFLHKDGQRHVPFRLFCVDVAPQMKFVVLSEVKGSKSRNAISNFFMCLKRLDFSTSETIEVDFKLLEKLSACYKSFRAEFRRHGSNQLCRRIATLWEECISKQLRHLLKERGQKANSTRLELHVSELKKNLLNLFHRLFLQRSQSDEMEWHQNLRLTNFYVREKLNHHLEFLTVKSYQYGAINWDREEYPGMLHFIFVKRMAQGSGTVNDGKKADRDEIISSTLYVPVSGPLESADDAVFDEEVVKHIKNQVWKGVSLAYSCARPRGDWSLSYTDGDFRFTSHFWEDSVPYQGAASYNTTAKKHGISGVERNPLASLFQTTSENRVLEHRRLELHMVHFSTVTNLTIDSQGDRLSSELASFLSWKTPARTRAKYSWADTHP